MSDFHRSVFAVVRRVPRGRLVSYGAVAALLGQPRAARGVGRALAALPDGSDVPWWRVVNRHGAISLPGGMAEDAEAAAARGAPGALQRMLLESEGVRFGADGRASWKRYGWQPHDEELAELGALVDGNGPDAGPEGEQRVARVRRAVSVLVRERGRRGRVLVVRRPADDEELPDAWGLPASTLSAGESWAGAVRRTGREKLGVRLRPGRELRRGRLAREEYVLEMRLFAATVAAGTPSVPQPHPGVTQYRAWEWAPLERLEPAATRGSLCCRLALGIP